MKVILSYIIGIVVIISQILFQQLLGICITKNKEESQYSFIIGYIVYSFYVAIIGIPIQLLGIKWIVFFFGMLLGFAAGIYYIVRNVKQNNLVITKEEIIGYIKNNWLFYIGALIVTIYALSRIQRIWNNNNSDDGYYVSKMACFPYANSFKNLDPVSGLSGNELISNLINTYESEYAFYIYLFRIPVTLYARLFMNFFNYFVILNAIFVFIKKIFIKLKYKLPDYALEVIICSMFLLFIMNTYSYITAYEATFIESAAYYGSVLSRNLLSYLCLIPLIDFEKLNIKKFILIIMVCVVAMSKSSVSLPVLLVYAESYFFVYLLKNNKPLLILYVAILFVAGYFITPLNFDTYDVFANYNNHTYIFAFLLMVCLLFVFRPDLYEQSLFVLLPLVFASFPYLSNITDLFSQYSFVKYRMIYAILQTVYMLGSVTIAYLIFYLINNNVLAKFKKLGNVFLKVLLCVLITGVNYSNYTKHVDGAESLYNEAKIYFKNPYIIPQSTVLLGKSLERLYKDYYQKQTQPVVMMSPGMDVSGYTHLSASILRTYAPHCISLIGTIRIYEIYESSNEYNGFSVDDLQIYIDFANNPNDETADALMELEKKYPFNTLVGYGWGDTHYDLLTKRGFNLYDVVIDEMNGTFYHVFVKAES